MKVIENAVTDVTTTYFDKDGNPEPPIIEPYVPKTVFIVRSQPEITQERSREYNACERLEQFYRGGV